MLYGMVCLSVAFGIEDWIWDTSIEKAIIYLGFSQRISRGTLFANCETLFDRQQLIYSSTAYGYPGRTNN